MFHLEWDNLNKITANIHGSNVVISTDGIMTQEVKHGFHSKQDRTLPIYKSSNTRSLMVDSPETLAPINIYSRVGPIFPERTVFTPPVKTSEVYSKYIQEYRVWLLARVVGSSGEKQVVSVFGGFISATGAKPSRESPIDYFTPSNLHFTAY